MTKDITSTQYEIVLNKLPLQLNSLGVILYEIKFISVSKQLTKWTMFFTYDELYTIHQKLLKCSSSSSSIIGSGNDDGRNKQSLPEFPSNYARYCSSCESLTKAKQMVKQLQQYYNDLLYKYRITNLKDEQSRITTEFEMLMNLLPHQCVRYGDVEMLDYFFKRKHAWNMNYKDRSGATILHYMIALGEKSCLEWLLKNNYNNNNIQELLNIEDGYRWTPLSLLQYLLYQEEEKEGKKEQQQQYVNQSTYRELCTLLYESLHDNPTIINTSYNNGISKSKNNNNNNNNNSNGNSNGNDYDNYNNNDGDDNTAEKYWKKQRSWLNQIDNRNITKKLPWQYITRHYAKKRLFCIINPFSGTKKALNYWDDVVVPILHRIQYITYTPVRTKYSGHATEIVREMKLDAYDGILALGGDGVLSEVINGLFTHNENSEKALNMPLSLLPCGTGNGLACELGWKPLINGIRYLLDGLCIPMDAYIAKQYNSKDTLGFVSAQWATIAAIDLESDSYRWMGKLRFDFKAFLELMRCKYYTGRIYYRQATEDNNNLSNQEEEKDNGNDNDNDAWWMKLDPEHPNCYYRVDTDEEEEEEEKKGEKKKKKTNIPKQWKKVEADVGLCCVANFSLVSEGVLMGGKDMTLNNGVLKLVYCTRAYRPEYFGIVMGISSEKFLEYPSVHSVKIIEAVIEPLEQNPPIDVDGEPKPTRPLYIKVLPHRLVVTC